MRTPDGLILTFLLNALWQVTAVVTATTLGDRLLRRGPARHRHALWLGATLLSVLLPLWSLIPQEAPVVSGPAPIITAIPGTPAWTPQVHEATQIPSTLAWMAVAVFGLSVTAHLLRLGRAWLRTRELARDAAPASIPDAALVERCLQAFGLRTVEILTSSIVGGPVTLGALRPAIVLPPGFLDSPEDQVTAALGHEMAHIRRRDFLVNLFCEVLLLPIAFHPATRWLRRRLAESREMACDEAAVERLIGARPYARSLLALASTLAGHSRPAYTLGALDADILEVRMRRLVDPTPRPGARKARASLAAAVLILGAVALFAAGLSLEASAASSGSLQPFVGVWKAEYPLNPGDKPLPWVEMQIRDAGGQPAVDLTFFRNRRQEDGSVQTDKVRAEVTDPRITGNVLRFRTRGEFQYKPGQKETVEFDQVFEIASSGEATLRQTWSSLEGRKDAPPPPPAPIVLRRAG
ncbi:MAG TPA: M56 family metallopeptidase [Thermoanaerobaculia bacterium]|jgi:beta-lactamase regulating signal transducer with metallopeptidase domain|nr:M56 family metallopeptidase [Thermoanaerobaculia bacterium]